MMCLIIHHGKMYDLYHLLISFIQQHGKTSWQIQTQKARQQKSQNVVEQPLNTRLEQNVPAILRTTAATTSIVIRSLLGHHEIKATRCLQNQPQLPQLHLLQTQSTARTLPLVYDRPHPVHRRHEGNTLT